MSLGEARCPGAVFLKKGIPSDYIFEPGMSRAQPMPGMSLKHFFYCLVKSG